MIETLNNSASLCLCRETVEEKNHICKQKTGQVQYQQPQKGPTFHLLPSLSSNTLCTHTAAHTRQSRVKSPLCIPAAFDRSRSSLVIQLYRVALHSKQYHEAWQADSPTHALHLLPDYKLFRSTCKILSNRFPHLQSYHSRSLSCGQRIHSFGPLIA